MAKAARNSKLIWLGAITVALGAVQTGLAGLGMAIPPLYAGVANMVLGVLIAVLRFVTTEAIAREDDAPSPPSQ